MLDRLYTDNLRPKKSEYGWIITKDYLDEGDSASSDVGTIGPSNISDEMMKDLRDGKGKPFRLYDDDRELYYEGRYLGEFEWGDPLSDFGTPNAGCTYMMEKVNGKWEITIG